MQKCSLNTLGNPPMVLGCGLYSGLQCKNRFIILNPRTEPLETIEFLGFTHDSIRMKGETAPL